MEKCDSAVCSVTDRLKQEQFFMDCRLLNVNFRIQMKNQKTAKEILWKQLEKNLKESYHHNIQNILNLKMWENGTAQCHQPAQARAVLTDFCLCNVEFRIRLKNQKTTLNTRKFKIPKIVGKWDTAICSVTDRLKQEQFL